MTLPISSISLIRSLKQHIGQLSRQAKAEVRGAALPAILRPKTPGKGSPDQIKKPFVVAKMQLCDRVRLRRRMCKGRLFCARTHRQHSQAATAGQRQGRTRLCRRLLRRRQSPREQRLHYFDHFVFAKLYQLLVILVKIYANRFTTGFQSPAWNCRSRLTVGYQGLSSRPFSQRQSASVCKRR